MKEFANNNPDQAWTNLRSWRSGAIYIITAEPNRKHRADVTIKACVTDSTLAAWMTDTLVRCTSKRGRVYAIAPTDGKRAISAKEALRIAVDDFTGPKEAGTPGSM